MGKNIKRKKSKSKPKSKEKSKSKSKNNNRKLKSNKKLSAKELGGMWKKLPEKEKKVFIDQYEEEKKKYEKLKEELENKSKREKSKSREKNNKVKAKPTKEQQDKNNRKACNCGECDECKKLKLKSKELEEEEEREKGKDKQNSEAPIRDKEKEKSNTQKNIKIIPLPKRKEIPKKNKKYKFIVGSRRLKIFGPGGRMLGGLVGSIASPFLPSVMALGGVNIVNTMEKVCDDIGALHVCLLLGDDIFEYGGDNGYERHRNVGRTEEFNWKENFEIEGETEVSPDELDEKIIKSNEWLKEKYDEIAHNCHSFIKFCCDIIEPDPSIMSVTLVNVPQDRIFRVW